MHATSHQNLAAVSGNGSGGKPSILFPTHNPPTEPDEQPACFVDLNLDQVLAALTRGKEEYRLSHFYYRPLLDPREVEWRQAVFGDVDRRPVADGLRSFAEKMRRMRLTLMPARGRDYLLERERWWLAAVEIYCDAVASLNDSLEGTEITSDGLAAVHHVISDYAKSTSFSSLMSEARELHHSLAAIRYSVTVSGQSVTVSTYEDQADLATEVQETFSRFRRGSVEDYHVDVQPSSNLNHVEAEILNDVARLFPEIFSRLDAFYRSRRDFADKTLVRFDREIQFYIAYLDFIRPMRNAGLSFCYPEITLDHSESFNQDGFDLALAAKTIREEGKIVCNDFRLSGRERLIVVTGPNQGGKTTFARSIGQMHYLASLGCPIAGRNARLALVDGVYTHFSTVERVTEQRGRLQDHLERIHVILESATARSLIIMNEIFSSTTIQDALLLGREILDRIQERGALAVLVTFLDELAYSDGEALSMVARVDDEHPSVRTFKVVAAEPNGLAHALSLAERHGLRYESLVRRLSS